MFGQVAHSVSIKATLRALFFSQPFWIFCSTLFCSETSLLVAEWNIFPLHQKIAGLKRDLCGMRNQHCTQDVKTSNVIFGWRAWWAAFNWVSEQLEWSRTELNKLGRVPAISAVAKLTGSRGFKPKAFFRFYINSGLWSNLLVKSVLWQPLPICEVCCLHIKTKSRLHIPAGGQFSSIRRWPTFQILHVRHLKASSAAFTWHNYHGTVRKCKQICLCCYWKGRYWSRQAHPFILTL